MDKFTPLISSYAETVINRERATHLELDGLEIWFSDDLPIGFRSANDEWPTVLDVQFAIPRKHASWVDGGGTRAIHRRLPYQHFQAAFMAAFDAWRVSGVGGGQAEPEIQTVLSE
jgi:hypothetical protein